MEEVLWTVVLWAVVREQAKLFFIKKTDQITTSRDPVRRRRAWTLTIE